MTLPPMRPQIELQRVHDMLMDVLSDEELRKIAIPEDLIAPLAMATDCLCWVLHHDEIAIPGASFAGLIQNLEKVLTMIGHSWESPGEYVVKE